jgi:hypothetical protein
VTEGRGHLPGIAVVDREYDDTAHVSPTAV